MTVCPNCPVLGGCVGECAMKRVFPEPRPNGAARAVAILQDAAGLVAGPRQQDYGTPEVNFGRIAHLWSPVLGMTVEPWQVALCMAQLKVARLIQTPDHEDSWTDGTAYLALGGQLARKEGGER